MTDVDDHAHMIHARDQPPAERRETRIARLMAAVGEYVGLVVGEDRAAYAGGEERIHQIEIIGKGRGGLEMKRDRQPAVLLGTLYPGVVAGDRYPAFLGAEFTSQQAEPRHRLDGALASRRGGERDVVDAIGMKAA
jgi:hypothetical protein